MKKYFLFPFLFIATLLNAQSVRIGLNDTLFSVMDENFYGTQYHANTFDNQIALNKLQPLELKYVRIWAEVNDFHPSPNEWNWKELDGEIDEIINAGYQPLPCLWGEKWFVGSADSAWWNYPEAVTEWENAAFNLANRYKGKINGVIIFDELNMLKPEGDYYCPFKKAAQLYIKAAKQIKKASPEILCGGPSGPLGWENAHWANYVLVEPDGKKYLDFVSSNVFLSWNEEDSDSLIINRTIWYEEVPLSIRKKIGDKANPFLLLDAYNVSAIWEKNGEPWTDPRNTNYFGGVYQALALLHSAKGGFKITLRWETLGGFGIFKWYPSFQELPPYYAWKFIVDVAGLSKGAKMLGCFTTEPPNPDAQHISGVKVNSYEIQPFAIEREDGGISIVLANKDELKEKEVSVKTPRGMKEFKLFQFNAENFKNCFLPINKGETDSVLKITVPPFSVTVIKYFKNISRVKKRNNKPFFSLKQNYPNPFNSTTVIKFFVPEQEFVNLTVFNLLGEKVRTLINNFVSAGWHSVTFEVTDLPSGIYYYRIKGGKFTDIKKMIFLK